MPDPDQFAPMYVRQEAVLSSQIEGTNASLMDVLEYEVARDQDEARVDVREIINYISAMNVGLNRLETLPLARRLMCEVHAALMHSVRGGEPHKTPGEFRRTQNWIGGGSPATASYVPPPPEEVGQAFAALENFLHDDSQPMPRLVKAGLAHAQFETIHPFLDGNGRTGRLLITFWLVEQGVLSRPLLYPSLYFKKHRDEYVARLQGIRDEGAWESWLAFFLDGIAQVAAEATERAQEILSLRERDRARMTETMGRRAHNALVLIDHLFKFPVVSVRSVQEVLSVSQPTASALVRDLAEEGLLRELTGRNWGRVFAYGDYLDIFPGASSRS